MLDELNRTFNSQVEDDILGNDDESKVKCVKKAVKLITGKIPQLDKHQTRMLGERAWNDIATNDIPYKLLMMIIDITTDKLQQKQTSKENKTKKFKDTMNILYVNHGINEINLQSILNNEAVIKTLPVHREMPMIT